MGYRELIKKVQDYSGFSDTEAKDALDMTVEVVAVRLDEGERHDFASQLPTELEDIALAVRSSEENTTDNIFEQVMELQDISESHAKKQLKAAWRAIKEAISPGELHDIEAQLPNDFVAALE